jgi:hypothetical protein
LFWWSLGIIDAWRGGRGDYARQYEYGTDFFHYLRVILIWMPLAVVSSIATYLALFFFLFFFPLEIKGLLEYLGFLAAICLCFGVYQISRTVIVRMAREPNYIYWKRHLPGALVLVRKYIAAKIEGTRPIITFVGNPKR